MKRYHGGIKQGRDWFVRLNNEQPAIPNGKRLVARCRDQHGNDVYLDVTSTADWQQYNQSALGLLMVPADEAETFRK